MTTNLRLNVREPSAFAEGFCHRKFGKLAMFSARMPYARLRFCFRHSGASAYTVLGAKPVTLRTSSPKRVTASMTLEEDYDSQSRPARTRE